MIVTGNKGAEYKLVYKQSVKIHAHRRQKELKVLFCIKRSGMDAICRLGKL